MKKSRIFKIISFFLLLLTVFLLFLLFKRQIFEIIKLGRANDKEGLAEFVSQQGYFGVFLIIIIEAIQMVVVVISAEFVQIAAGLSYKFHYALLFCMTGVALGASIIYLIVNILKLSSPFSKEKKIAKLEYIKKKNKSVQLFMYILFIMPTIPFGAICYYGASKKIGFKRYLFTCVTGVIPSIITSCLLGNVFMYYVGEDPKRTVLAVIITVLSSLLLLGGLLFIVKKYFMDKETKREPSGLLYKPLSFFFNTVTSLRNKLKINLKDNSLVEPKTLIIVNHASFYDIFYVASFLRDRKITIVMNRYYTRYKIISCFMKGLKIIPKRMFYPDIETVKMILSSLKDNQYVVLFPSGRLSTDGVGFEMANETGTLIKKTKANVAILSIEGAYLADPKWAKYRRKGHINVSLKSVYDATFFADKTAKEVDELINKEIAFNDYDYQEKNNYHYHCKDMTKGLDGVLYLCPKCHSLHTLKTEKSEVLCEKCGFRTKLGSDYRFTSTEDCVPENIHLWNELQKKYEEDNLTQNPDFELNIPVFVKKLGQRPREDQKGEGVFSLSLKKVTFVGTVAGNDLNIVFDINKLQAIPFSVNEEFDAYFENELYYFYPKKTKSICNRVSIIYDVIYKFGEKNESE